MEDVWDNDYSTEITKTDGNSELILQALPKQ